MVLLFYFSRSVFGPVGVADGNIIPDARLTASTFYIIHTTGGSMKTGEWENDVQSQKQTEQTIFKLI